MAAILETYYKLETLETLVKTLKAKNEKGIKITTAINDEAKKYTNKNAQGEEYDSFQNVSSFVSQSKEQWEAKANKFYVANGSVVWVNDSGVKLAKDSSVTGNVSSNQASNGVDDGFDDLPF